MNWKDAFEYPLSAVRDWIRSHERVLVPTISWTLALVFIIVSLVTLLKSLGIL